MPSSVEVQARREKEINFSHPITVHLARTFTRNSREMYSIVQYSAMRLQAQLVTHFQSLVVCHLISSGFRARFLAISPTAQ